ncbi:MULTISPECIES: amino acid ABC transporter permease [Rhizobium/Agrobacterium group]|jgi:polar amino acid transport system permease protein|uniref:ABC transporter, membrane spanning protein (Amino acid) n=2 Tax=Agrobacterium fabrum TaxID=1176649 RepID=A9CGT2_AGRFC|nr:MULTISPECIES: amino acid ABC transporter permease [Rhizobium/Agrobacterium group]KEY53218.1 amino acid ABC transporter permease [Agrobacterium tumefaciens]AAK88907.1 ABC transporter, membrane spanning protein (amino acid) [Agrobacterium fabrum str. C58]AYM65313.1 polar amino acid transport system permease protein [Agrobacterium fabrum]EGL61831.1 ABC transporter, membrane spanning protein (amino acid) [Agrobacterium sp. ATCC 31749]KJX85738.1 Arginine transport system permease protein artQ [A
MASIGPNELFFLMQGLKWTLALTLIGFIGGGVFGLCVALARVADSPAIQRASMAFIAVFQGTPLLMQLFVVYYGVALAGLNVDAWIAVAIAFTLHASAFLGEIWRGGIQAVPKGQTEAANALGLHYVSRMKDVVLPQAFKISLPATIGFLVQLIKGTSLAAIVGFVELSRAGQIVSNQTFRPLTVFAIVGIIYFLICWPLSLWGAGVEKRLQAASR